ncbi:MAG: LacI family DNA-binding transcriptional regulator [Planctomycetes bacterium]|nr:LacI family DNA-binding transcriptional regulator [Planctomycetota bacterium]
MIRQKNILELLKLRIAKGAYQHTGLPAERELADEIGVARMTARKALAKLEAEKVVKRLSTGRLELTKKITQKKQIAILVPSLRSYGIGAWIDDAVKGSETLDAYLRPIYYDSYDDPVLTDTFQRSSGVFFIPRAESTPHWVTRALTRHPKVVVLENDMSELGVPSIDFFTPASIHMLLNHLLQLGHERIDLINNQGPSQGISMRIDQWKDWCDLNESESSLIDLYTPGNIKTKSQKKSLKKYLSSASKRSNAIVCTSLETALMSIRIATDLELVIGKDISISLMDGETMAHSFTPSITSLERPNSSRHLKRCMEWMLDPNAKWKGSLIMDTLGAELFVGESTNPA